MIDLTSLNIDRLTDIYLVSNTPSYLLKHFRREPSVQALAQANAVRDLFDYIVQVDRKEGRSLQEVAAAYAAVVALTYCESPDVNLATTGVEVQALEWYQPILDRWRESLIVTAIHDVRYRPLVGQSRRLGSVSTTRRIVIEPGDPR